MKLVFFDTETTGTGEEDRLCQLAYKVEDQDPVVCLFKPPLPIKPEAAAVTNITNKMVADMIPFIGHSVAFEIERMAKDPEYVFVAHNAIFDLKMLAREGIKIEQFICTLRVVRNLDKEQVLPKNTLQFLRHHFEIEIEAAAHDAGGDIIVLEKLYELLLTKGYTAEKMIEISSKPTLLAKMLFGKYKGQPFSMIPPDYLYWMKDNVELSEDLKYTVYRWIEHYKKKAGKK